MKKIYSKIFWGVFIVLLIGIVFNNYIVYSRIYLKYKYGINYNNIRIEKSIPLLPNYFEYFEDEYYDNILIWKNIEHKKIRSDSIYVHIEKAITIRNSEIVLEKDLYKMKVNDSIDYNLIKKYYYKKRENLSILEIYLNNNLLSLDTIFKLDKGIEDWFIGNSIPAGN